MRFLYTGAKIFNDKQDNYLLSLGGFISSTIVPNDRLNNIFSDISYLSFTNNTTECKALILENVSGVIVQNVRLGYKYPTNKIFKMEIAAVALSVSSPQQIEKIANSTDIPYYANFAEAMISQDETTDDSINIGNLANNARIAIWFKKSIVDPAPITDYYTYYKDLFENPSDLTKKVELIIKYQIDQ